MVGQSGRPVVVAGVPGKFLRRLVYAGVLCLPLVWFFGLGGYQRERLRVLMNGEDPNPPGTIS